MKKILLLFLICLAFRAQGQGDFRPSIYFGNLNFYNPASGWESKEESQEISLYFQKKWVDNIVYDKPTNVFANYLGSISDNNHISIGYVYDSYSFYNRNLIYTGYAKTKEFSSNSRITFGARAAFYLDNINEENISQDVDSSIGGSYFSPDLDLGIQYQWKGLILAVSGKNLFKNSVNIEGEPIIQNQRQFNTLLSYQFYLGEKFGIAPLVFLSQERSLRTDVGLNLSFSKKIDFSYLLRIEELRSIITLGTQVGEKLHVGIAVDNSSLLGDINTDLFIRGRF